MIEFTGELETHLTVSSDDADSLRRLRDWGIMHGLKFLHIVLDRGVTASQPMFTRRGHGTLSGELAEANRLRALLQSEGFTVTRVKIEAAPWNQDIPQSETDAVTHPAERHFEHHIKLLLKPGTDKAALIACAQNHNAHVSRNALRRRDDNHEERFVTQRCFGVGQTTAKRHREALLADLAILGHSILDIEEEYVVFDSNLDVDAGWITTTPAA